MKKSIYFFLVLFYFLSLSALAASRITPSNLETPSPDSGVFLYIGNKVLEGKIPYKNVWDHKGPLIYYINSLSLMITSHSWWGIWIIQVIWLGLVAFICFLLLKKSIPIFSSVLISSTIIFFYNNLGRSENYTESFSILFVFFALYSFSQIQSRRKMDFWGFVMGLAFAGSFMLRPNLVATWVAIGLFYIFDSIIFPKKYSLKMFMFPVLGALLGTLVCLSSIIINGAFMDFIDSVFLFNFAYSADKLIAYRSQALINTIKSLVDIYRFFGIITMVSIIVGSIYFIFKPKTRSVIQLVIRKCFYPLLLFGSMLVIQPLFRVNRTNFLLSCFGFLSLFITIFVKYKNKHFRNELILENQNRYEISNLEIVAGVSFILEFVVIVISGRSYQHYYQTFIPSICVLLGAVVRFITYEISRSRKHHKLIAISFRFFLLAVFFILPIFGLVNLLNTPVPFENDNKIMESKYAHDYLLAHTKRSETVLFWGKIEVSVNFSSGRDVSGKYIYTAPFYVEGYCNQKNINELEEILKNSPPDFIIDTNVDQLALPTNLANFSKEYLETPCLVYLNPIFQFIDRNYTFTDEIKPYSWRVYRKK